MASKTAGPKEPGALVVDLSEPTISGLSLETTHEVDEPVDPLSSLSALATALDAYEDVPTFLNTVLAPHLTPALAASQPGLTPDLAPIDKQLGELLTRLNMLSQDTSSALEQSIHDISRTVPRLTYDLQFMRESAVSLQSSLSLVQDRVARQTAGAGANPAAALGTPETDEARTHRALDKLAYLDKLKTRMESARDVLAEAESWSTLESEITSFIADKAWTKAGERLAEASKSLVVFQSADGEYESKRSLLVSLQNELETALSAALRDAIARVDTPACASFHDIFRLMDRGHEFQNYYFAARRAPIAEEWANAVLLDAPTDETAVDSTVEPVLFSEFLPKFYAGVLSTLSSERSQIPLIFPTESASSILAQFFQTTLDELSPSFHNRLSSVAEHHGAAALPELIRAFKATEELGVSVQGVMDKLAFNTQGGYPSGNSSGNAVVSPASLAGGSSPSSPAVATVKLRPTPATHAHSHRLSISHRFSRSISISSHEAPAIAASPWETNLYEPFLDIQTTYPALEKRYLSSLLRSDPVLNSEVNKDDPSRTLNERAAVVFGFAEDAIGRCLAFTHGYGALGLIDALNELVNSFLTDNTGILEAARSAAHRGAAPDELDFEGLDYSTEDWGAFQLGLHVLEVCRSIRDRLTAFEGKLHLALTGIAAVLNTSALESIMSSKHDTTMGAITLLQQSTLNSAVLYSTVTNATPPGHRLIRARDAVSAYTRTAQVFLQSIILSPLQAQLEGYPALPVWSQPDKAPRRGELQVPTFSLSPTDTIARVSEGLLNLLRVFEVYADDDALAFSIETLPFVDVESLSDLLNPPKGNLGETKDALTTASPSHGSSTPHLPALSAEAVLSTWVSSLALSLLSHLTRSTLPGIRSLSNSGAAQLASDLAYLSNAVRALDVEWDDLERWREAAECKDQAEWRDKAGDEVKRGVWAVVGMLRGWS
ncbi:uncharacterized protein EHS24_001356 [Apiotrichum porosum]|uniref:Conserved oligomeric Golgi complex subunit 7 n=1 Tax=Apiotrichum porosum TaxID=105984 RepID=A0A427XKE2_9TREE|nr:uncharacterized protein EHS24_001356 [Apiotrichum porosum]RSH79316.1 hypothetical protein EHS24_001356 [Apiotrichum porosum]